MSLFAVAPLCRFWSVGFSACVFAVVFSLAFVCCLLCCGAASPPFLFGLFVAGFVVLCGGSPPAGCCLPPPLRLFPCGVLVQFLCWSLPLGIWLLHATARLPCLNAWGVVVLCFLASFFFMAAKAFGPVWGLCYPLHHGAFVVVELCAPALRYSSSDDPGPLWTPLSYTLATLGCMCDMLCSCPFLPSRRPFSPFLFVWLCSCVCGFLALSFPSCNFFYPHLGERSLELSSLCVCSLVCLRRWLILKHSARKEFCH